MIFLNCQTDKDIFILDSLNGLFLQLKWTPNSLSWLTLNWITEYTIFLSFPCSSQVTFLSSYILVMPLYLYFLKHLSAFMPSNHLILCHPLFLSPSIFPSVRVFSNESALCIRWPKYWSFSFSISPSNQYSELFSFQIDWFDLLAVATLRNVIKLNKLLRRIFNRTQKRGNHEGKSPCELDCSKI